MSAIGAGDARRARSTVALALLAAFPLLVACDEGAGPQGSPSAFDVFVYLELDDSAGMGDDDQPVRATVTVSGDDDLLLVDSTGADGHVRFEDLASGTYTVSHVATDPPPEIRLRGSPAQSVVAPFAGTDVETRFVYGYRPGLLIGVAYRDDDASGAFEAGLDSVFEGVQVRVFAGADTTEAELASDVSDADGMFDLGELEPGEHTLLVQPRVGTAVVGGNPRPVTIVAGETTFHAIEFVGEPLD